MGRVGNSNSSLGRERFGSTHYHVVSGKLINVITRHRIVGCKALFFCSIRSEEIITKCNTEMRVDLPLLLHPNKHKGLIFIL